MTHMTFIHALSPLHAGTGQGVGVIDLPIAREKATELPYLPGSSLKGVLRDVCDKESRERVFGPDSANADKHAGAAQFSDQRLLALPTRSLMGVFAWITSPFILRRVAREAAMVGIAGPPGTIPEPANMDTCLRTTDTCLSVRNRVVLEDLDLESQTAPSVDEWSTWLQDRLFDAEDDWRTLFNRRFCIVHNDVMTFLCETATEVVARIRMDEETGIVADGGLWYEEALPAESLLYGLVSVRPNAKTELSSGEIIDRLRGLTVNAIQLGGHSGVGRGLCRVRLS